MQLKTQIHTAGQGRIQTLPWLAVLVCLTLVFSACTGSSPPADSGGPTPDVPVSLTPEPTAAPETATAASKTPPAGESSASAEAPSTDEGSTTETATNPAAEETNAPAPAEGSEGPLTAIIGLVWQDRCEGGDPAAPPADCDVVGGELHADAERDPDEPGLTGVVVRLASGECPGEDLATATTGPDGSFEFGDLSPGTYCVTVDPKSETNRTLLDAGRWTTLPASDEGVTVEVSADSGTAQVEFGWEAAIEAPASAPASDAVCQEKAAFFADVTIPDGTVFRPGAAFTKTWRIRNEGTCTWTPEYSAVFASGHRMSGSSPVPLPRTILPGEQVDISVELAAPKTGGLYVGNWQLQDASGNQFGLGSNGNDYFWVKIAVSHFPDSQTPPVQPAPVSGGANCPVTRNTGFESQVLALINNARSAQGLPPLRAQGQLTAAAVAHSTDMACADFVDHTGSNGSSWFDRVSAQGYNYAYASENIYVGSPDFGGTPQGAFDWWMNSQVHRDNILSTEVTEAGIGYVFRAGSSFGGYYTIVFARP